MLNGIRQMLAAGLVVAAASAAGADTLDDIKASGRVRIGIPNVVPYGYVDGNGKVTGQAAELVSAFFADMGVTEIRPVVTDFGALIGGLLASRLDVISAGMWIQPERCRQIAFGNPEFQIVSAFAVHSGNPKGLTSYQTVAANPEVRIGMLTGAGDIRYAELAGITENQRVLFPDFTSAIAGLQARRVDAVVASTVTIQNSLRRTGDPGIEYAELTEQPRDENGEIVISYAGMGFRKDDVALREAWNDWLAEQIASGRATEIMEPFGFGRESLPPEGVTAEQICSEKK